MIHSFLRLLARTFRRSRPARCAVPRSPVRLRLEALEDRWLPSATSIAGFVYNDANNNGIMDSSESGLAANTVELHRADGSLVATTTTDANGHYIFNTDPTVNVTPKTEEFDTVFPSQSTNWTSNTPQPLVQQFDPSLGTLTSVQVISQGNLTTDVKVENAAAAVNPIDVQVVGQFTLSADGFGTLVTTATGSIDNQTTLNPTTGDTTFTGTSSFDFGSKNATATNSATFDAATQDLSAFIGTGTLQLTEGATVSSSDTGNGNFDQRIRSQADGSVQVIYTYIPTTGLKAGDYYVEHTTQPPGFFPGQTTNDNKTPIANSYGVNRIDVHLDGTNSSLTNNFGEVPPASLAGFVYHDLNANGAKDGGEPGLGGVTVTLTGTDVRGNVVNVSQQTNADGSYSFDNLWAGGDYTITETTLPSGYLDPSVSVGSQGGVAAPANIAQINLGTGVAGVSNNFGHVLPSSLAGFVYADPNDNGIKENGESGIGSVGITLSGTDYQGNQVFYTTDTVADGSYSFTHLAPGTYTISKAPPPGYITGIDTPGSLGGTTANDQLFVNLAENKNGLNYNFGELTPPVEPPPPPVTPNGPPGVPVLPPVVPAPPPPPDTPFGKWFFLS